MFLYNFNFKGIKHERMDKRLLKGAEGNANGGYRRSTNGICSDPLYSEVNGPVGESLS